MPCDQPAKTLFFGHVRLEQPLALTTEKQRLQI